MLYVYLLCKRKGWGKTDGNGRLPFSTALLDLAVIAIGVGLLLVGNKVIGPMLVSGDASDGRHDRLTDLIGIALFAAYFIALSLIPKVRAALNGRAAYALMMPVIILGGIYGGVFTPTEASAVAVIYALFVGMVVYGEIKITDLASIFKKSVVSSSVIMFIIANAGSSRFSSRAPAYPMQLACS